MLNEEIEDLLGLIGETCRQRRIGFGLTQQEQAEKASISLKAAQKIESGYSGQTLILFKYLNSLDLLSVLSSVFPDPFSVSPVEELALKQKASKRRPRRVSKSSKPAISKRAAKWGDEE